jgi:hypothetical protein
MVRRIFSGRNRDPAVPVHDQHDNDVEGYALLRMHATEPTKISREWLEEEHEMAFVDLFVSCVMSAYWRQRGKSLRKN